MPEPPTPKSDSGPPPAAPLSHRLIAAFCRSDADSSEKGTGRIRLRFPTEQGDGLFDEFEIDLEYAHRNTIVGHFPFIPISGEGTYTYVVESLTESGDWQPLFEVPLEVSFETGD